MKLIDNMKIEKITQCELTFKERPITLTIKRKLMCQEKWHDLCKVIEESIFNHEYYMCYPL